MDGRTEREKNIKQNAQKDREIDRANMRDTTIQNSSEMLQNYDIGGI